MWKFARNLMGVLAISLFGSAIGFYAFGPEYMGVGAWGALAGYVMAE